MAPPRKLDPSEPTNQMKTPVILIAVAALFTACDARVDTGAPPVVEKNTAIVNPPEKVEKKSETTTVTSPGGAVEKKTTETTK